MFFIQNYFQNHVSLPPQHTHTHKQFDLDFKAIVLFLAHLSRRLIGELIIWQGCCLYVCLSTFSNVFFSKTAEPIEAKFHVEPP